MYIYFSCSLQSMCTSEVPFTNPSTTTPALCLRNLEPSIKRLNDTVRTFFIMARKANLEKQHYKHFYIAHFLIDLGLKF